MTQPFEVNGLLYVPDYITDSEQQQLIRKVEAQHWSTDLSRCTQQYGYKYDYGARGIDLDTSLASLPFWLQLFANRLHEDGLVPEVPDQVIVNEYLPGQGIVHHIDCAPCFGDVIVSLSLVSPIVMDFKRGKNAVSLLLEPKSLLILHGEARYQWKHGIARRKTDVIRGKSIARRRRLSVTFRKVILTFETEHSLTD